MAEPRNQRDTPSTGNVQNNILAESIRLIYASTPSAVAAIITSVCFLIYLFKDNVASTLLYGWGAYMVAVAVCRAILHRAYSLKAKQHDETHWGRLFIIMAAMTGAGWGYCALLIFPELVFEQQLTVILVIVAYCSGALTTTFPLPAALASILLPAVIPLAYRIFDIEGALPFSIGSMLVVFVIFVSAAARRLHNLLMDSLQLRFENEALAGRLKQERDNSERLNISLLHEVEERKLVAERLIIAHQEAEQANMAKTHFLANMSHDIRTPLNGIIGMTRLILDTPLSTDQQKFLENIKTSADGLLGLLNDILDLSKIEAGQLLIVKQDFHLPTLLAEIRSTMAFAANEKNIQLIFPSDTKPPPLYVRGDELRLRQILLNLVGNAVKFSEKGSVEVMVTEEEPIDESPLLLHFSVSDTGIGIPEEKQEEIFSSFSQADSSTTRQYGGTGLGLAISRQLVEMMNGRIWLESEVGRGSTFHFTIPLEYGREENIPRVDESTSPVRPVHILLVDDNMVNRDLAQLLLEKDGHAVVTAEDGLAALQCLVEDSFDLIFLDIQMPKMDGLTAAAILRACETGQELPPYDLPPGLTKRLISRCRGRHTPIVAMTANAMEGDRQKSLQAGMDGYLTKPFDPHQVKRIIAEQIG